MKSQSSALFPTELVKVALWESVVKLNPIQLVRNPVMFTVEIGTVIMLFVTVYSLNFTDQGTFAYNALVFGILLLTLLFANFAEAIAEARGKAQANSLRKTREETPAKKIVLFGESLGGAVATWLAAQEKPGVLVLASTFTSIPDLASELYPFLPVRWISRFQYDSLASLQTVSCPVLISHSPDDEIIPYEHGQRLFQAASEPKQFLQLEGGHNIGFVFMQPVWIRILSKFMAVHLTMPQ